jgi:hypothetical protein
MNRKKEKNKQLICTLVNVLFKLSKTNKIRLFVRIQGTSILIDIPIGKAKKIIAESSADWALHYFEDTCESWNFLLCVAGGQHAINNTVPATVKLFESLMEGFSGPHNTFQSLFDESFNVLYANQRTKNIQLCLAAEKES